MQQGCQCDFCSNPYASVLYKVQHAACKHSYRLSYDHSLIPLQACAVETSRPCALPHAF